MDSGTAYIQKNKNCWLAFTNPTEVISTCECKEVLPTLSRVAHIAESGSYAAGFVSYEAAPAFDDALCVHKPSKIPLLWFGLYEKVEELSQLPEPVEQYSLSEWMAGASEDEYLHSIEKIKKYIEAGDTYQVNYSVRLNSKLKGAPYSFFYNLHKGQGGRNCAFIDMGEFAICSASPELFFALDGKFLKSCPMKGTAPRGLTWSDDQIKAKELQESIKDRAENVMIVDMIRNDMGRIAESGSVVVESTYDVERYPTVLQMTSTVRSETSAGIDEIFQAMFPCASITGAPKVRTMEIIRELEPTPRGLYTGTIGCIAPGRKALFNVAIRTVVVDKATGDAEYGVGGGVVWDSVGKQEYSECLEKSRVLASDPVGFSLLETMLWSSSGGYAYLEEHIERVSGSAKYFDYPLNNDELVQKLMVLSREMGSSDKRVRLLVDESGVISLEVAEVESVARTPVRVRVAAEAVDSKNALLYHKTTKRGVYEDARKSSPECDDVMLYNENGYVTETTTANIVVVINGRKLTPSVECGLLPGTMRESLLKKGEIEETKLSIDDVKNAGEVFLINSVRGWRPVQLVLND